MFESSFEHQRLLSGPYALDGSDAGTDHGSAAGELGARAQKVLDLVEQQPGITGRQIAERSGISLAWTYRPIAVLRDIGKIDRTRGGWLVAADLERSTARARQRC